MLKRARDNLGRDVIRFQADLKVHEKVLNKFLLAVSGGNMQARQHLCRFQV